MEVYIGGEKQDPSMYEGEDDLGELLTRVKEEFSDTIVSGLEIDGVEKDPNRPPEKLALDEVERIDIKLKPVDELMQEAIETLHEYAPRVKKGFKKAAVELKLGDSDKGLTLFSRSVEGLEWCVNTTLKLRELSGDRDVAQSRSKMEKTFEGFKMIIRQSEKYGLKETSFLVDNIDQVIDYAEHIEDLSNKLYQLSLVQESEDLEEAELKLKELHEEMER